MTRQFQAVRFHGLLFPVLLLLRPVRVVSARLASSLLTGLPPEGITLACSSDGASGSLSCGKPADASLPIFQFVDLSMKDPVDRPDLPVKALSTSVHHEVGCHYPIAPATGWQGPD